MTTGKTHYRKAFDSPYLSSADVVEPTVLTVKRVALEKDKTKKTKDEFNTAYFVEQFIRPGERLKPMILNATNSKTMKGLTGSAFIDDWTNQRITVFVDPSVKFGNSTVEGLRISAHAPEAKRNVTPATLKLWENAKAAFMRDGNLVAVLNHANMTEAHQEQLMKECEGGNV